MVICGADSNLIKIAFPAILASPKAQNLTIPSKIDEPSCQIPNLARGGIFDHVEVCIILAFGGTFGLPQGPPEW